jgi:hypothetical protein
MVFQGLNQCCGSGSAWIRIILHQSDMLDPDPDPHKFADDKPKCMEYEPISAVFQGFSRPLFGS